MGLALLIVVLKSLGLRRDDSRYDDAARFWARIFGINFVMGVVTGIPMEFQFGTNWSEFSRLTGSVIGQPLAMEGAFSFFLESAFLGLFLFRERRLSRWAHWGTAVAVMAGSWLSGYFIIVTDAWMQHPVGFRMGPGGSFDVSSFLQLLGNPWALIQYAHTMCGAVVTASFVVSGVGALYMLLRRHQEYAQIFLRVGVTVGTIASILQVFPTGDLHGKYMARHQPVTTAAMEGLFQTEKGAPIVLVGQPDVQQQRIDNPVAINDLLSFLAYGTPRATVQGLDAYSRDQWPTNISIVYYAYHIMVGLGTWFVAIMLAAAVFLWRGRLFVTRWLLWPLMLSVPLPYIANIAGWVTAETGRQPWIVYGLLRTAAGYSPHISTGNVLFTLLGFMGMYAVLSILFLLLVWNVISAGPENEQPCIGSTGAPVAAS
jgi:cytochrome d ubiquinol oxidase subunit I